MSMSSVGWGLVLSAVVASLSACGDDDMATPAKSANSGATAAGMQAASSGRGARDANMSVGGMAGKPVVNSGGRGSGKPVENGGGGGTGQSDVDGSVAPEPGQLKPSERILGQTCSASTEQKACAQCDDTHCCETRAALRASPAALAYSECVLTCWDDPSTIVIDTDAGISGPLSCEEHCDSVHHDGVALWAENLACREQYCIESCSGTPASDCDRCISDRCAAEETDLVGSAAGTLFLGCISTCSFDDSFCQNICRARYPTVAPDFAAVSDCMIAKCPVCTR